MNIPKAINILTKWKEEGYFKDEELLAEAERLGIEALKFRDKVKAWYPTLFPEPLPGETND
ncbi:hypothetical protein ES708_22444 [subsurface metagenome]